MPLWLQTLLKLREDHIIRSRNRAIWIGVFGALLFTTGTLVTYYMANVRIPKAVTHHVQILTDDSKVLSIDSPREKPLLISIRMVASTLSSAIEVLGKVWLLIAAYVPFCLILGCYGLRLYEIALENQRLKKQMEELVGKQNPNDIQP